MVLEPVRVQLQTTESVLLSLTRNRCIPGNAEAHTMTAGENSAVATHWALLQDLS